MLNICPAAAKPFSSGTGLFGRGGRDAAPLLFLRLIFRFSSCPIEQRTLSGHGSRSVKGKTHTYYQVLIDARDCPHIVSVLRWLCLGFFSIGRPDGTKILMGTKRRRGSNSSILYLGPKSSGLDSDRATYDLLLACSLRDLRQKL